MAVTGYHRPEPPRNQTKQARLHLPRYPLAVAWRPLPVIRRQAILAVSAFSQRGRQTGQTEGDARMFGKMTLQATRSGSNLCVIFTARDAKLAIRVADVTMPSEWSDEFVHHARKAKLVGVA